MSKTVQARILLAFPNKPGEEILLDIEKTMFEYSGADTLPFIEPQRQGNAWMIDIPINWHVSSTFDEDAFINALHARDEDIGGVVLVDMTTMYGGYEVNRSRCTSEYWTRWLLARFISGMVSSTLGSFDSIVPSDMMPFVTFPELP